MRNRFVLLALLLPAFAACSSDSVSDSSSAPAATTQVSASSGSAAAATTTTVVVAAATTEVAPTVASGTTPVAAESGAVAIADFKFDPASINVPVGGSVVWTNNDPQQHTATSAGNFDAGTIQPGATATVEFKTAGTFTYICSFHPFMMGTVVVG